jgi:phage-related minor tail protein
MAQGVLNSQKSMLDMLPKTIGTVQLGTQLEVQKINLQIQEITVTERLIRELELSRLSAEKLALESRRDEGLKVPGLDNNVRNALINAPAQRLKEIEERTKVLTSTNIGRDVRSGALKESPETLAAMQQQQGSFAKIAALASQKQMVIVKGEVEQISAYYTGVKRDLDNELKQAVQERDKYMRGDGFRNDTLEVQQQKLAGYTENEARLSKQIGLLEDQKNIATAVKIQVLAQKPGWEAIAKEAGNAVQTSTEQYNVNAKLIDGTNTINKAETDRKNNLEKQLAAMRLQNIELDLAAKLTQIDGATQQALLDLQKQELQLQLEKGIITVDSYNEQLYGLEKIERVRQRDLKLTQLQQKLMIDSAALGAELASATGAQMPEIIAKMKANSEAYNQEVAGIAKVFDATEKLKTQQKSLSDRQMAYTDLFKGAMKSMEDAIIEFTKTGKLNFSSMIDSFIEGLLRYEIQQQQMSLIKGLGGASGIVGMAMNFFGGGNAAGNSMFDAGMNQAAPNAKGAAYDYGVQAFAKGGAFTNQIVDSPTLFKFARGTGLMGEAGPEAIMPLTRDNSGNLGVRAQGGGSNVEVVVNNYSTAKAETRETTDSRGNRRVEVVVGDMVAQEVTRTGSAAQTAFSSTYGTRPALARR